MAIFNHTYSGLITRGLGLGACCGLVTMGFGVFKCTIQVVPQPPVSAGGGGGLAMGSTSVPMRSNSSTIVRVNILLNGNRYHTTFHTTPKQAQTIVKVSQFISTVMHNISVTASNISKSYRTIVASFRNKQ